MRVVQQIPVSWFSSKIIQDRRYHTGPQEIIPRCVRSQQLPSNLQSVLSIQASREDSQQPACRAPTGQ